LKAEHLNQVEGFKKPQANEKLTVPENKAGMQ
jgi:hypothetical protein